MRLEILDRGHRLRTKALLALIRLVSKGRSNGCSARPIPAKIGC